MVNERRYTDAEYIAAAKMIEDHLNRLKIRTHEAGGPLDGPELSLYGRFTVALGVTVSNDPALLAALEATEAAEDHWANCEECEEKGAQTPEMGCETGFFLADKARLMRRAVIRKVHGDKLEEVEADAS